MRIPLPRQSQVFFLAILAGLLFLSWLLFKPFVIFMVTGLFVAILAMPIDRRWERVFGNRLGAVFTMITLMLIILLPLVGLGFALANDARALAEDLQGGGAQEFVDTALGSPVVQRSLQYIYPENTTEERNATVQRNLEELEVEAVDWLRDFSTSMLQKLPDFFIALVVILFVVYYVLTDGERLVWYLRRAAPLPASQVDHLLGEAHNGLRAVFVGQILTSLIQGGLGGIGFLIAGLPGAIVWASVMAVLSLLPVVGAFLVWVPAAAFLLARGDIGHGVFLIIWGVVVVSQVDNVIRPKLIGDRANIHPLFVLIGVLGGVAAFGFIGLFLGPLIVGVTISMLRVWEDQYLDPSVGARDASYTPSVAPVPRRWWQRRRRPPPPTGAATGDEG